MVAAKLIPFALGLLWAGQAAAQAAFPCPKSTIGWALQWPASASITSASYDSGTKLLYIVFNYTIAQAFNNVPIGIMQSLSYTQNPLAIYNTTLTSAYQQILLTQKDNCPLSWEFGGNPYGYVLTNSGIVTPTTPVLGTDSLEMIVTDTGQPIGVQ